MKSKIFLLAAGVALATPLLTSAPAARAQSSQDAAQSQKAPLLHALFSDNAVLQRDRAIPIWGWAAPGQSVAVTLAGKSATAHADASGRWMARLGPFAAGGPHTLSVSAAGQTETRSNILFGDVWLCSGQSNMEMGIANVNNAQAEIDAANFPGIRLFTVPKGVSATPQRTVNSKWLECTPQNITQGVWGGFSAVAYFFGRKLNQELKVPIGLIHSSWGGTVAEAWVSESALGTMPDFRTQIAAVKEAGANTGVPYQQRMDAWIAANDSGAQANWATPSADDKSWISLNVPGNWENSGQAALRNFDGIAWYRREVNVPAEWAGQDLTIHLGAIDDADTSYWNGAPIGSTTGWATPRVYKIPGAQVLAGRNVIAVRVVDNDGLGGIAGSPQDLRLERDGAAPISLAGPWKFHESIPASKLSSAPLQLSEANPNVSTVLYNAMIAPLEPYGIKGAIWYQGESNSSRPEQYARLLPVLINDWRRRFDSPLPFHIVQLAGFMAPDETPRTDDWPLLRAAQARVAQTVPRTGLAITTDIGDEKDIHPKDKQDVGLRLALSALALDYGKAVEYLGPTPRTVKPRGAQLVVDFSHAAGGLTLKGEPGRVFAIAGADRNWFWATPAVQGTSVVLSSPMVPAPVSVRFGWSNLPRAALYNGANLPAAPFQIVKP
jgi:sialate O-acetylesterase